MSVWTLESSSSVLLCTDDTVRTRNTVISYKFQGLCPDNTVMYEVTGWEKGRWRSYRLVYIHKGLATSDWPDWVINALAIQSLRRQYGMKTVFLNSNFWIARCFIHGGLLITALLCYLDVLNFVNVRCSQYCSLESDVNSVESTFFN